MKKPILEIHLQEKAVKGTMFEIHITFNGVLWEGAQGLFRGAYHEKDGSAKKFVATHFRPNDARRMYPCFDEPGYKVPYCVSIGRPKDMKILFVTPLKSTKPIPGHDNYVLDSFETTPPISTYALGFLISDLKEVPKPNGCKCTTQVWARADLADDLKPVYERIQKILTSVSSYLGTEYPLKKLEIVALPGLNSVKPIDIWGLLIFKESDLLAKGYYNLAQELIYNWLGAYVTPAWHSDAHVNKAIAGFLAASTVIEIDGGSEFEGKYPMTILYSIYYEFSKRYPHSRITGMKQETTCSKTELVLRMLNYTLGGETFKKAIRNFIDTHKHKTFKSESVWDALTKQAREDKVLDDKTSINEIANSWIDQDRIPVVNVKRDYKGKAALVTQRVFLRERPHDVPERDKLLWWIPLVVDREDKLNFTSFTPSAWMRKERQLTLKDMPDTDQFIIINPEEIGPFPVNYDEKNWNLIAAYLQTDKRNEIPVFTRAKLLHDAWNLAYAGNLSFVSAFNMTLFMKHERHHLVWNPVFTFIDHIGKHIDSSPVHKKFETYVRNLLTPLYEDLGPTTDGEPSCKLTLRSLSKTFLCRAGYKPCIQEAQDAYKRWMDDATPDEGNPVANQYICPVFKWGTNDEWKFGLQRVINFPSSRKQSERTYLLKTLAGCPLQPEKTQKLLTVTLLEENGNFTENDIFLIFSMLTSGSNGYTTLLNFLQANWDTLKTRYQERTNLWDNMISSATGSFNTQAGFLKVQELYNSHRGQFGSAEHIIEKNLKNIKEESKWSDENLPVIEKWLDDHLSQDANDAKFMGK